MKLIKYTFLSLCVLLVCGCSILSPVKVEPPKKYSLHMAPTVHAGKRSNPKILFVVAPDASPYFKTTQMAYVTKQYETSYFTKNRWTESPAKMLLPLIVGMLHDAHYFRAIVTQPVTGNYDYMLYTQILDLQQNFTKRPSRYEFTLRAQLFSASNNKAIKTKVISVSEPVMGPTLYDGVRAANRAVSKGLKQLAIFSLKGL